MLNSLFISVWKFIFSSFFYLGRGGEKYLQESCQGVRGLKEALETLLISFFTPLSHKRRSFFSYPEQPLVIEPKVLVYLNVC